MGQTTTRRSAAAAGPSPDFRETGAFYVMRVSGFRAHQHRFFGRTRVVEVPELTAMEIDPEELIRGRVAGPPGRPPTVLPAWPP